MNVDKILEHLLDGTRYEDGNLYVANGTLYWRDVPMIELYPNEVVFYSLAFSGQELRLQRAMFDLMKQQGIIDRKAKFSEIEDYTISKCKLPRHKPKPVTVPVCDDTRGLL